MRNHPKANVPTTHPRQPVYHLRWSVILIVGLLGCGGSESAQPPVVKPGGRGVVPATSKHTRSQPQTAPAALRESGDGPSAITNDSAGPETSPTPVAQQEPENAVADNQLKTEKHGPGGLVQLVVPLDKNGRYSLRDFRAECNRTLGTSYQLKGGRNRKFRLTKLDKDALELAAIVLDEFSSVDFNDKRFVIAFENPRDKKRKRAIVKQLTKTFGWPAGTGLQIPDGFKPRQRTMLLIHGLEAGPADMQRLVRACKASGIQSLIFDYPNDGPLSVSGERLNSELADFSKRFPQARLAIVAHSMGGLVARHCLENSNRLPDCITDLIMLATPHHGASLAYIQPWIELVFAVLPSKWDLHNDGLGESAIDLMPKSEFLSSLNARPRPSGIRYHLAIGRKGLLTDRTAKAVEQELEALMARKNSSLEHRASMRRFIRSPELRTGHGDGAVTIRSATLENVASTKTFDLTHREIYQLPGQVPERSPVFSWMLEVLDWNKSAARSAR